MGGKSGGGSVNFPDPNDVARAQYSWNNLNQYTPYGSLEYTQPTLDTSGNVISQGSASMNLSPQMQQEQGMYYGLRNAGLGQLLGMFNGSPVDFGSYVAPPVGDQGSQGYNGQKPSPFDRVIPGVDPKVASMSRGDPTGGGATWRPAPDSRLIPGGGPNTFSQLYGTSGTMQNQYGPDSFYSNWAPSLQSNLDLGSLPGLYGAQDLTGARDQASQAVFQRGMNQLSPVQDQQMSQLKEQLANRGVPEGSDLYNEQVNQLARQQSSERENLNLSSIGAGQNEMSLLSGISQGNYGQTLGARLSQLGAANQARGQAYGEVMGANQLGMQQQGQQYNQLASILGLTPAQGASGGIGGFFGPGQIDMGSLYGQQMNAQMANQQYGGDFWSGILGLGGKLGGAAIVGSDSRIKSDVTEIEALDILNKIRRIPVSEWRYIGQEKRRIGPMADDFNAEFGENEIEGVKVIDVITMMGALMAGIQALAERIDELEGGR